MYVSSQLLLGSEERNGTQKGTKVHACTVAAEVCENHVYIYSAKVTLNSEEIKPVVIPILELCLALVN